MLKEFTQLGLILFTQVGKMYYTQVGKAMQHLTRRGETIMTTATKTRKTVKQLRTMHYLPTAGLLFITEGKKSIGYAVVETTHLHNVDEHVRSFQLGKPDGTTYDVLLDGPGSQCDCIGFEHRGMNIKGGCGCKHIAAMTKLQQLGKL